MAKAKTGTAPCVLESERAALGMAILGNQEAGELLTQELCTEDFYDLGHRAVYGAIRSLMDEGLTVNPVSIAERSGTAPVAIGDLAEQAKGLSSGHLKTLVSDIQRVAGLRNTYYACQEASGRISKDAKLEDVLEILEKQLFTAGRTVGVRDGRDGSDVMDAVITDFLARHAAGGGASISTGLKDLDRAIIGLRPGKNVVIAARPSMGKTALADTIRRAVVGQGYGAIQFSLEMGAEELLERELAYQAQTNLRKVLAAKDLTPEELERVKCAAGSISPGRWVIDDSTYSISGIRRRARVAAGRMARAGVKLALVVIDYIQLAGDNGDGREQSVAAISRGCKLLAKDLGCTVLALSQLNRQCELRDDRRPFMSDLRESGSIEQDADIVAFVYREHMYDSSYPPEDAELIIRKHRSGPTGTVRLKYNPKVCTFEDQYTVKSETQNLPQEDSGTGKAGHGPS